MDENQLKKCEQVLGHRFENPQLLERAITHASTTATRLESNERLEFLGDAVLGLIVCDMIFRKFPNLLEGEMTKIKSMAVSRQTCAAIANDLGLERLLILGKGMQTGAALPASLSAAALESVIGALYLDGGYDTASKFIRPLFRDVIDRAASSGHQQNFKSVLQQHVQHELEQTPMYRILAEQGPDHAKVFQVCVEISGRRFPACWGNSKKRAEQDAALAALRELGVIKVTDFGEIEIVREGGQRTEGDAGGEHVG